MSEAERAYHVGDRLDFEGQICTVVAVSPGHVWLDQSPPVPKAERDKWLRKPNTRHRRWNSWYVLKLGRWYLQWHLFLRR